MVIINKPRPTLNGRLMKNIFISGTTLAKTASITIISRKAASMGAAILREAMSIIELDSSTPLKSPWIDGIVPTGKV